MTRSVTLNRYLQITMAMKTCVIAMDCWPNMPRDQIRQIRALPADLHLSQHHDQPPHPLLPAWPQWQPPELERWIRAHRPCRLIYVGQHWDACIAGRPTGMRTMSRFRPGCRIQVRPSLCRVMLDLATLRDREMTPGDLNSEWRQIDADLYQLPGEL